MHLIILDISASDLKFNNYHLDVAMSTDNFYRTTLHILIIIRIIIFVITLI